ncbi:MAG TPA: hypothetical protein VFZ00_11145 [Solirubrobacter sp.]|nr:hypothetical protein [Solirubrobacter sp.]
MIALLHMFIRSTVDELRRRADESDRPGAAPLGSGDVLRGIANAIETAAKRTLLT